MFTFNFGKDTYSVSFYYNRSKKGTPYATNATLYHHDDSGAVHPVLFGRSRCHSADQFQKVIGRKLALASLMESETSEFRDAMWAAYKQSGIRFVSKRG